MAEKRRSSCNLSVKAHAFSVEALIGAEKTRKLGDDDTGVCCLDDDFHSEGIELHIYSDPLFSNGLNKRKLFRPFAMKLEIELMCILFPLIILEMFLQLDWSKFN
uniref:Uncharacterized protein n=1 Tax=Oncorhynchus tshawytscha TaxID=74940 RepID=A0AAZ3PWY7_ONCTS